MKTLVIDVCFSFALINMSLMGAKKVNVIVSSVQK